MVVTIKMMMAMIKMSDTPCRHNVELPVARFLARIYIRQPPMAEQEEKEGQERAILHGNSAVNS